MSNKTVNITYNAVNANVTIPNTQANVNVDSLYIKSVLIPTTNTNITDYDNPLLVVVKGVDESSVPTSQKYRRALDNLNIGEIVAGVYNKNVAYNQAGLVDVFQTVTSFIRTPTETVQQTSELTKLVAQNQVNAVTAQILLAADYSKIQNNQVTSSQILSNSYTKPFVNNALINSVNSFEYLKYYNINISSADSTDYLVNFVRNFSDSIDATDDYYGSSNIDDDQYALFSKTLVAHTTSSTRLSKAVSTQQFDNLVSTILLAKQSLLLKFDDLSAADLVLLRPRKGVHDYISKPDVVEKNLLLAKNSFSVTQEDKNFVVGLNKVTTSTTSVSVPAFIVNSVLNVEAFATEQATTQLSAFREFYDQSSLSVTLQNAINTQYANSVLTAQLADISVFTRYMSAFSIADYFERQVNYLRSLSSLSTTAHTNSKSLQKPLTSVLVSQTELKLTSSTQYSTGLVSASSNANKVFTLVQNPVNILDDFTSLRFVNYYLNETPTIADSGVVSSQNYFTEAYVEPGYVGTNSYF